MGRTRRKRNNPLPTKLPPREFVTRLQKRFEGTVNSPSPCRGDRHSSNWTASGERDGGTPTTTGKFRQLSCPSQGRIDPAGPSLAAHIRSVRIPSRTAGTAS